jgi:hypothetical protein
MLPTRQRQTPPPRFLRRGVALLALLFGVLALTVGAQFTQTAVNGSGPVRIFSGSGSGKQSGTMPQKLAHWLAEQYVAHVRGELPPDKRKVVRQKACARAHDGCVMMMSCVHDAARACASATARRCSRSPRRSSSR